MLKKWFKLTESKTSIKIEITAGFTTFMSMAYIIFVNPHMLKETGMPFEGVLFATCISAAAATILMGLLTNYPFALAPGMGLNAYFTYTICLGLGIPWQTALGAVFISGVIFLLLTVFKVWKFVFDSIPSSIKFATGAGIGMFLAFIGLQNGGIVAGSDFSLVQIGELAKPKVGLTFFGLFLTGVLMARRVKGSILVGIVGTTLLAVLAGETSLPDSYFKVPDIGGTFFQIDIPGALQLGFIYIIFVFLFMDIFDTLGTLIGIGEYGGFLREGKLPKMNRALAADSIGTIIGSLSGTSTVTSYIESSSGIVEGGKTGLVGIVVGLLFLGSIFLSPIASIIPPSATAPALIVVGSLMIGTARKINWDDVTEAIPAFLTIILMPLTFSIANGIAIGFITYPVIKGFGGKRKEVSILTWVLAILFIIRYIYI
ncbi:NCS2 family permease [candidate division KSB1 bacterium]